jgi:hypothetical protein
MSLVEGCFVVSIARHFAFSATFNPAFGAVAFLLGYFPTFGSTWLVDLLFVPDNRSDFTHAFAIDLSGSDAPGDGQHRDAVIGRVEGLGENGSPVREPSIHFGEDGREIIGLNFPDHHIAMRLLAVELGVRKLEELRRNESWDPKQIVDMLAFIPFQIGIFLAWYGIAVNHEMVLLLLGHTTAPGPTQKRPRDVAQGRPV